MIFDDSDKAILQQIQNGISLTEKPFLLIADSVGLTEEAVLERINSMKESGIIRRISGFFDAGSLGYQSALCGAVVQEENIELYKELLDRYPCITHNYLRDHRINGWFTVSTKDEADRTRILSEIRESGLVEKIYVFKKTKMFKLKVLFDLDGKEEIQSESGVTDPQISVRIDSVKKSALMTDITGDSNLTEVGKDVGEHLPKVTPEKIRLIRELQEQFPICSRPFEVIGEKIGMEEQDVLRMTSKLKEEKRLKRISAALSHHKVGYNINSMVVWDLREEDIDRLPDKVLSCQNLSHCYLREKDPDFDYNFYTMLHAKTEDEYHGIMDMLKENILHKKYVELRTVSELKKIGMKYFTEGTI